MDKGKLIGFIGSVTPLPKTKVEDIASHFQKVKIRKNEYFIEAKKVSDKYLFLDKGFIRAFTYDPEGDEVTTGFYSEQNVVFEVGSFFQKTPSQENFQALEDCEGWYITYDILQELFHSIPEFREFGRMILVKGFISFKQRTLSLINETAEQRYDSLINSRPEIFQKAPLKFIASYLGITDTSLSRIRREIFNR